MAKSTVRGNEHNQPAKIKDELYSFLEDNSLDPSFWGNVFTEKHVTQPEQMSFLDEDTWLSFKDKARESWERKIIDTIRSNFLHLPSEELETIINNYGLEVIYWVKVFKSVGVTTNQHLKNLHKDGWTYLISRSRKSYPHEKIALHNLQRRTQDQSVSYLDDEDYINHNKQIKEVKQKRHIVKCDNINEETKKLKEQMKDRDAVSSFESCRKAINTHEMKMTHADTHAVSIESIEMLKDILSTASSGLISRGFYTSKDGGKKTGSQAIEICGQLKLMRPETNEKEEGKEFFTRKEYDEFQSRIGDGMLDISLLGSIGKGSYSRQSNSKNLKGNKLGTTFYSKMKSSIISVNTTELDKTNIRLTVGVVDQLKKVENLIRTFGKNSTLARDTMLHFFQTIGTHVSFGLVTLGGVYMSVAMSEQTTEKSLSTLQKNVNYILTAIHPVKAQKVKEFGVDSVANSSNESDISKEHFITKENIQTKILKVGGPSASDFFEWKNGIVSNPSDLAIIHMENVGIWYLVEWREYGLKNPNTLSQYIHDSFKILKTKIGSSNDDFQFYLTKTCNVFFTLQRWLNSCQNVKLPELFEMLDHLMNQNDNPYFKELIQSSIIKTFIERVIENRYTLSFNDTILIQLHTRALVSALQSTTKFEINAKILNFQNEPVWELMFDNFETCIDYIKTHMLPIFEDESITERFQDQLERELFRFCEVCEVRSKSSGGDIFRSRLRVLALARHRKRMEKCFKSYSSLLEFSFIVNSSKDGVCKSVFSYSLLNSDAEFKTFIFEICIPMWEDMNLMRTESGELNKLILSNIKSLSEKSVSISPKNSKICFRNGVKLLCNKAISVSLFKEKCTQMVWSLNSAYTMRDVVGTFGCILAAIYFMYDGDI